MINTTQIPYFLPFLVIGLALLLIIASATLKRMTKETKNTKRTNEQTSTTLPYQKTQSLLSPPELTFYNALKQLLSPKLLLIVKVNLADLLYIPNKSDPQGTFRNKICQKHIDFVLCDAETLKPRLAIELDGPSHKRKSAQRSDHNKNNALKAAGLPLLRVPQNHSYDRTELKQAIRQTLSQPSNSNTESPIR